MPRELEVTGFAVVAKKTILDFDALRVGVDVEVVFAEEAHQRHPELPRRLHGEA